MSLVLLLLGLVTVVVAYRTGSRAMIRWRLSESPARPALYVGLVLAGVVLIGDRVYQHWWIRPTIAQLKHEDPKVAARAVATLAIMGPQTPAVIPALIDALQQESSHCRIEAAQALGHFRPVAKEVVSALTEAFQQESSRSVRIAAAEALGRIGPDAKEAVPALVEALKQYRVKWAREREDGDGDWRLTEASFEALKDKECFYAAAVALIDIDPEAAAKAGLDWNLPVEKSLPPGLQRVRGRWRGSSTFRGETFWSRDGFRPFPKVKGKGP